MNDLTQVFDTVKRLMKEYEPPFVSKMDDEAHFDLWSNKEVVIAGKKRDEVYFAGLVIQKKHVGFYYMPVYTETDLKSVFEPELLSLLKGKSCFHLKKLDPALVDQIKAALKTGYDLYRKNGWV
jgi:hypothetical protein